MLLPQWGKKLEEITQQEDRSIRVTFTDGSSAGGTFLAGCDGSGSKVKEILCDLGGSDSRNRTMPVRFLGASADLRGEVVSWLRNLDPLFFQGTHPNNSFMFFGIQDTPATVKGASADTYRCQINISWPYREGFLGQGSPIEVPDTKEQQLSLMKTIAGHWKSPFKDAVDSISGDAPIRAVKIVEYVPVFGAWDNLGGRATLVGDAAHAMTMYRGEAANHSIKDVESLVHCIKTHPDLKIACLSFEKEMIDRTSVAVKASSQACRDAHEHARIDKESLLISKRAIVPGKSVE